MGGGALLWIAPNSNVSCKEKRLHNLVKLQGGLCNHFSVKQLKMIIYPVRIFHHATFRDCVTLIT